MDDVELLEKANAYATRRGLTVGEGLGFGIHGIVVLLKSEEQPGATALKVHHSVEFYRRECEVYERLMGERCTGIRGFRVPQLLRFDDELLGLEMTVVAAPHVLDFAGAYLDFPPQFSEEIWAEWERKNQEQFGDDWAMAQIILDDLRDMGIHMIDPSPSNIRFR